MTQLYAEGVRGFVSNHITYVAMVAILLKVHMLIIHFACMIL